MSDPELLTEVLDDLGQHRREWDALVAVQPLPSPFLRSWWIDHVGEGDLRIVACSAAGRLVGGAAFQVDRVGTGPASIERVRCVGQGVLGPDHLDLIATPGHHLQVARSVVGWLRRRGNRVVDLDGLSAEGTLAAALAPYEVGRVRAPYAALGGGVADYLAARPGKVRSTVKRTSKRFDGDGVVFITVAATDIDAALDDLARLHESRWSDDSVFLRGWERFRNAARAGAATNDVVVHQLLDADSGAIAVELDLVLGGRVAFYQAGRRTEREWRGCGSVLRARIIEAAVAAGASEYDLLRGDEGYKTEWATGRRELVHCVMGVGLGEAAVRLRSWRDARAAPTKGDEQSPAGDLNP